MKIADLWQRERTEKERRREKKREGERGREVERLRENERERKRRRENNNLRLEALSGLVNWGTRAIGNTLLHSKDHVCYSEQRALWQ